MELIVRGGARNRRDDQDHSRELNMVRDAVPPLSFVVGWFARGRCQPRLSSSSTCGPRSVCASVSCTQVPTMRDEEPSGPADWRHAVTHPQNWASPISFALSSRVHPVPCLGRTNMNA
ncbi:hypothetical protein MTO96_045354 [Rhipicephalus appendiculatus]